MMAMLTPTPFMRPTLFEHFALLRNFSGLRPTLGTVLRITADIGSIWIAFLFGWLVVDGNDLAALATKEPTEIAPVIGFSSLLACITYAGVGLYSHAHKYTLLTKIGRIALVNVAFLFISAAIVS